MDTSDVIAALALIVSIGSAWVSYATHQSSKRAREAESEIALSRERSELLVRIERARDLFDHLHGEIERLLSSIKGMTEKQRASLLVKTDLLAADLKYLQGCQRQASSLWDEAYEMRQFGLAHHTPRFLKLIEDDEAFASDAMARCKEARGAVDVVKKEPVMFIVGP